MSGAPRVFILNGPNLDRLAAREPLIYGGAGYDQLCRSCHDWAAELGLAVQIRQAAGEGELVSSVHEAAQAAEALLLNAAGYTHTSVALRDALLCLRIPCVAVHISQPGRREPFRRRDLLADVVTASVQGFGLASYRAALVGLAALLGAGREGGG